MSALPPFELGYPRTELRRQLWGLLAFTLWHEAHVERQPGALRSDRLAAAVGA